MSGGQQKPPCIPWLQFFIIISCWQLGWPGQPWCVILQMPPPIKPMKRMNPTTIKNQEIKAKNLPSMSFRDFASNKVPARIVSNEIAKRCIMWNIKIDYSFFGFRRSRLVHGSLWMKSSYSCTNIMHFLHLAFFQLPEMRHGIFFQIKNRDIYFFFLKKLRYTEIDSAIK